MNGMERKIRIARNEVNGNSNSLAYRQSSLRREGKRTNFNWQADHRRNTIDSIDVHDIVLSVNLTSIWICQGKMKAR